MVCPPLNFGYDSAFVHLPGSTHLAADTFRAVVEQVVGSLAPNRAQRELIMTVRAVNFLRCRGQ